LHEQLGSAPRIALGPCCGRKRPKEYTGTGNPSEVVLAHGMSLLRLFRPGRRLPHASAQRTPGFSCFSLRTLGSRKENWKPPPSLATSARSFCAASSDCARLGSGLLPEQLLHQHR